MEVVQDFIIHYVPQAIVNLIDLNSIEPLKDSFINSDLQEKFSDLLFQCTISEEKGYLYFLFEHKSYMSNNTPFQLLKYMVEIWGGNEKG
ncbi:Rpn family recombination-promoting nuclease/putative transposase, partial [Gracilibacillus boraciitolerans]|uniref:Rpn family recombination-promoting nuclease/putative transposase n=1 Tax=Gracilibacillus boraciitolerans TaxID=307521 RepID=UPI0013924391